MHHWNLLAETETRFYERSELEARIQRTSANHSSSGGCLPSFVPISRGGVPQTLRSNTLTVPISPTPQTSHQRTGNEPVVSPVPGTSSEYRTQAPPFMPPDEMAMWLDLDDKGPPYYVVTHGREPGIYTDW